MTLTVIDFFLEKSRATYLIVHLRFGKWYHGQILSIVDGAELIRRRNSKLPLDKIFRHKKFERVTIDVDETYFFIHWLGFKETWQEVMSSEQVHRENAGLLTIAEASR